MSPYSTVHQCKRESSAISDGSPKVFCRCSTSLVASSTSFGSAFGRSFKIDKCRIAWYNSKSFLDDIELYQAIRHLSILNERPNADPKEGEEATKLVKCRIAWYNSKSFLDDIAFAPTSPKRCK